MKTLLAATAAMTLALSAGPAMADDHMDGTMADMTASQQTMYDGWPADRRATYDAWPMEAQTYYWGLTPAQTEAWWMLTNEQRVQIVGMDDAQKSAAWTSILAQLDGTAAAPASATAATSATGVSTSANIRFVSNTVAQNAPAPVAGEYPLCSSSMQDNCINPWEAGKRGPGVPRPLNYWPGKPASEM